MLHFSQMAVLLDMEVVLEIQAESELEYLNDHISVVNIYQSSEDGSAVDHDHFLQLLKILPIGIISIAEMSINDIDDVRRLRLAGFNGFLIGEYFMRQDNPMTGFRDFSYEL